MALASTNGQWYIMQTWCNSSKKAEKERRSAEQNTAVALQRLQAVVVCILVLSENASMGQVPMLKMQTVTGLGKGGHWQ